MKGLRKYLTPFAPDQSGAVSVLYELGGILIICDAGGCVGNICGFDEPRWQNKKSAVFSAGLRDMDAIMGRDEMLVKKLVMAAEKIDARFAAIIGTPVPSVIGTDYHALTKMAERKLKIPVLAIDTNGMDLYDEGASKAYLELVRRFVIGREDKEEREEKDSKDPKVTPKDSGRILGVFGCNPIDMTDLSSVDIIKDHYQKEGFDEILTIGMDGSFADLERLANAEKNIVVSVSGLAAARLMKEKYGIPYQVENVAAEQFIRGKEIKDGQRILIVDQQVSAVSMRNMLQGNITAASWFRMDRDLKQDGDVHLTEEDQFEELVRDGNFDVIIADPVLKRMTGDFAGTFIEKREFAVSGKSNC